MVRAVADRFGSIDVLVNNVGGNVDFGPFVESRRDQWRAEIDLNLITTFDCTQNVLPHMIERGSGRIINIGSTAGIVGDPLRSEEHTSELQSLMRISYAVFCLKKKKKTIKNIQTRVLKTQHKKYINITIKTQ